MWESIENKYNDARTDSWLAVPLNRTIIIYFSIWSCGLLCQEWTSCCLLSPLSQTQLSFSNEVKGAGLAKLKIQLGPCSFQWYPCWPNNCGPVALAGIIYYYCFNCFVIFQFCEMVPSESEVYKTCTAVACVHADNHNCSQTFTWTLRVHVTAIWCFYLFIFWLYRNCVHKFELILDLFTCAGSKAYINAGYWQSSFKSLVSGI